MVLIPIMLHKVYLSKTLPANRLISQALPDVKLMMDSYKHDKSDFTNDAPAMRPHPLEKYEVQKSKVEVNQQERDDVIKDIVAVSPEDEEEMILSLPQRARAFARRLLPFIQKVNYGDLNLRDLLYDLSVPHVKTLRTQNRDLLESVYRQLANNTSLSPLYYINKLLPKSVKKKAQSPRVLTHPKKSKRGLPSTPLKLWNKWT